MSAGTAIFAMTAAQAVNQISAGYAQRAESNYNASMMEIKARNIGIQQDIEFGQYQRLKGTAMSKSMASVAGSGLMPSGSPAAVMVKTQAQIAIDQAIGKYNFEMEKGYTMAQADAYRRQGKQAVYAGWSNAFSTALQGAASYAMYSGAGAKTTTLDGNPNLSPNRMANQLIYGK